MHLKITYAKRRSFYTDRNELIKQDYLEKDYGHFY